MANIEELICSGPLQICKFGVLQLNFIYFESCHYISRIHRLVSFSTAWAHVQARVFPYCFFCLWPAQIHARLGLHLTSRPPFLLLLSNPRSPNRPTAARGGRGRLLGICIGCFVELRPASGDGAMSGFSLVGGPMRSVSSSVSRS
jgi:hypothetical protein